MRKKSSRRKQKIYKMVGCSKKTRKNYLGKGGALAYTGKPIFSHSNAHLAYTGKGGSNVNAANPSIPNTGPTIPKDGNIIFSNASTQRGGCGCSSTNMTGGGSSRHRNGCKCSLCKKNMKGGNPYPNGVPWTSNVSSWPGVKGDSGVISYYPSNTYNNDVSRQIVELGGNPPFSNMKGGKRRQRGGNMSNFITQDLINLGRQFQFGVGTAYNALAGYSSPINPMPWKDQFHSKPTFNPATI